MWAWWHQQRWEHWYGRMARCKLYLQFLFRLGFNFKFSVNNIILLIRWWTQSFLKSDQIILSPSGTRDCIKLCSAAANFLVKICFYLILINVINKQFYTLDDRNVLKDEFVNMMLTWEINEEYGKTIVTYLSYLKI